ncbi:MAG: DinB family protein [Vicinamibacterales bacterium]
MTIGASFAQELMAETATTRRVLERVPEDRLTWRPHPKSMSLGQLAMHVATLPRQVVGFLGGDELDVSVAASGTPEGASRAELLEALNSSLSEAAAYFETLPDTRAAEVWSLKSGAQTLLAIPRTGALRSLLFNHWYHHRGQLTVYLRLLDVPLPSVYGPTADENPFQAI